MMVKCVAWPEVGDTVFFDNGEAVMEMKVLAPVTNGLFMARPVRGGPEVSGYPNGTEIRWRWQPRYCYRMREVPDED